MAALIIYIVRDSSDLKIMYSTVAMCETSFTPIQLRSCSRMHREFFNERDETLVCIRKRF